LLKTNRKEKQNYYVANPEFSLYRKDKSLNTISIDSDARNTYVQKSYFVKSIYLIYTYILKTYIGNLIESFEIQKIMNLYPQEPLKRRP
jgi:hypothetical protein